MAIIRIAIVLLGFAFCVTLSSAQNSEKVDTDIIESIAARESVVSPLPVAVKADDSGDFVKDDFNLYGIVALIVAFCSLVVSFVTWIAQSKTEKHTRNVPFKDQQSKFKDLSSFSYNNLAGTLAAAILFFDKTNRKGEGFIAYPSETLLKKMAILPEDIILSVDSKDVASISEIRNILRNNNIDIETTIIHTTKKGINESIIFSDLHNLLFRPFLIIMRTYELEMKMLERDPRNKKHYRWGGDLKGLHLRTIQAFCEAFLRSLQSLENCLNNDNKYLTLLSVQAFNIPLDSFMDDIERFIRFLFRGENYEVRFPEVIASDADSKREWDYIREVYERLYKRFPAAKPLFYEIRNILEGNVLDAFQVIPRMVLISAVINTDRISMINYE